MSNDLLVGQPRTSTTSTARSTDDSLVLRTGERGDAQAIVALESRAFGTTGDGFTLRQARALIDNPRAYVCIGLRAGDVVGWGVTLTRRHASWSSGRIYSLAVDPAHGGRGIGRVIARQLLDELATRGIVRVYLEVRHDNESAQRLYRSLGFEPVEELAEYYNDGAPAIRMLRVGENGQSRTAR